MVKKKLANDQLKKESRILLCATALMFLTCLPACDFHCGSRMAQIEKKLLSVVSVSCAPVPKTWHGEWGSVEGLDISCGGIAGLCRGGRTARRVSFEIRAPDTIIKGGDTSTLCIKPTDAIYGSGYYRANAFPDRVVKVSGNFFSVADNAYDGFGTGYSRLTDAKPSATKLPSWLIQDWKVESGGSRCKGDCFLQFGANDRWIMRSDGLKGDFNLQSSGRIESLEEVGPKTLRCTLAKGKLYDFVLDGARLTMKGPWVSAWGSDDERSDPPTGVQRYVMTASGRL